MKKKWLIYKGNSIYRGLWVLEFPYWGTGEGWIGYKQSFAEVIELFDKMRKTMGTGLAVRKFLKSAQWRGRV